MLIFGLMCSYAVIAVASALYKRRKSVKYFKNNPDLPSALTSSSYYRRVAKGRSVPQFFSLLSHVFLVVLPISALAAGAYELDKPAESPVLASLLTALTIITLIFNAFWIYPQSINYAQQYALKKGTASPLVKVEIYFAYFVWLMYGSYALYLFIQTA